MVITQEMLEKNEVACPKCGGRAFKTYNFEGCEQDVNEGEWDASEITGDDSYILDVTCEGCGHVLMQTGHEACCALDRLYKGEPERVTVLEIKHRHGTNLSLHRTDDGARDALYAYVKENWGEAFNEDETPVPADQGEAIQRYFDWQRGNAEEPEDWEYRHLDVGL